MEDTREFGRAWGRAWPPRIIAERGACWHAPGNSLRAIRGAAAGADAIALDVMQCGSGELVCCHERRLGHWDVATTALDTLQDIDLGHGERIALLDAALAAIPSDRLIDVRLRNKQHAASVIAAAASSRALDRLLISSDEGAPIAPQRVVRLALRSVGVSVMRHWHARGIAVEVWPVNTRSQLALAWSLGVDGVLTNDPVGARETFGQMQQRSYASGGA